MQNRLEPQPNRLKSIENRCKIDRNLRDQQQTSDPPAHWEDWRAKKKARTDSKRGRCSVRGTVDGHKISEARRRGAQNDQNRGKNQPSRTKNANFRFWSQQASSVGPAL